MEPIDQSGLRARSSAEEHYLDMVGVTGSIPVAPTIFLISSERRTRTRRALCICDADRHGAKMGAIELPAFALIGLLIVVMTMAVSLIWVAKFVSIA